VWVRLGATQELSAASTRNRPHPTLATRNWTFQSGEPSLLRIHTLKSAIAARILARIASFTESLIHDPVPHCHCEQLRKMPGIQNLSTQRRYWRRRKTRIAANASEGFWKAQKVIPDRWVA